MKKSRETCNIFYKENLINNLLLKFIIFLNLNRKIIKLKKLVK